MSNTISDWRMDQTTYCNSASRGRVDVDLDDTHLEVYAEQGSGYCLESTRSYIPVEVVVAMLRHAGYRVQTPQELADERGDDSCGQNI
jgi:hypothetical protein